MAAPVLETWVQNDGGDSDSVSHVANEPASLAVGDFAVIIASSDRGVDVAQYSDNLTGWDFQGEAGSAVSDSHTGVFTRKTDGTESWPITVTAQAVGDWSTYSLRISGFDSGTPVNVVNVAAAADASPHTIPSITTTVNDCLIIYYLAADGSSADEHALANSNGWASTDKIDEVSTGTYGTDNLCVSFGSKDLASFGATGNAVITMRRADGASYMQIAIAPSTVVNTTIAIPTGPWY